jgi:phosphate transport system substrate-binding protein
MPLRSVIFSLISLFISLNAFSVTLKVSGGAAPINNIFRKVQEPFTKKTGIQLDIAEDGPDVALKMVDEKKIDIASAGLGSEDWLKLMDEKKIPVKNRDNLKFRVVGKDVVKVIANAEIKIPKLSNQQLNDLFTGKTKNWKEIGGPDQKVVVVIGEKIPGTHKFFAKKIMSEKPYADETLKSGTAPEVVEAVKHTKGAIGLAPMGLDLSAVSVPKIELIGRPVSVATNGIPSAEALKLFNFIETEGKAYMPQ